MQRRFPLLILQINLNGRMIQQHSGINGFALLHSKMQSSSAIRVPRCIDGGPASKAKQEIRQIVYLKCLAQIWDFPLRF